MGSNWEVLFARFQPKTDGFVCNLQLVVYFVIVQDAVAKSRLVKAGSLIFANCGVSLGFARIITFEGCIHDGWLAMENIDERLNKIFLLQALNQMTEHFRKIAPSGTQPNLNTSIMKSHRQIIPPMEIQNDYIKILSSEWREAEIDSDELKNYRVKAEYYIRRHQDNTAIAKLKTNKPLSKADLNELEKILWVEVGTKPEYEAEFGEKPLGEFVREIVGLDMSAAKEAFAKYLDDTNLESRQIYFVNQIVEYVVHNGMMKDFSVLRESPFTDRGSIVEVFGDMSVWAGIRAVIEKINSNASAA